MNTNVQLTFFPSQSDFRKWLEINHYQSTELFVGFYKVKSNRTSITWSEAVDQAICFGWIDGVRKSIDNDSYFIRFTPRKPKSIWSTVNIKKAEDLTKLGFMKPSGLAIFNSREESKSGIYSYEKENVKLSSSFNTKFRANKKAYKFFLSLPLSYQKPAINWVMSAKQEITKLKRLNELITDSESGRKIKMLSY